MPLHYTIIESENLVYVSGTGDIAAGELLNHLNELSSDDRYKAPMKKLVDYRRARPMSPPIEEIESFANEMSRLEEFFIDEKLAVVVQDDLSFGITRVFMALSKLESNVFREFDAALQWLELPLDLPECPPHK